MRFRMATYNIHRCIGRDGKASPHRVAEVLRAIDADVVALQEVAYAPEGPGDVLHFLAEAAEAAVSLDDMSLDEVEKVLIGKALRRFDGNVSKAAEALGLSRGALYRRLEKHGL